ncbi:DUF397 domain-containing protein [Streptomyces sp. NPDC059037]|uniref:DUF397 domain-containing protein n=1 Tax=Streptomyces sp. NPDC059037 TaxID=3346710 RepID=UPI00367FC008
MIRKASAGDASGLEWRKSSFSSSSETDDCVEVATTPTAIHLRDSKNPQGPQLAFAPAAWADFVTYASGS